MSRGFAGSALALALAAFTLGGCGSSHHAARAPGHAARAPGHPHRAPPPASTPVPPPPAPEAPRFAIGITEANANLLWSGPDAPAAPSAFAAARAQLAALRPTYVRLQVDWAALQPHRDASPDFALPSSGCARGIAPCAAYAGLTDDLRALASQQRTHPGEYQPVIVIFDAPAWAARAPSGCEGPAIGPGARPLVPGTLASYRALVAGLIALGQRESVALRYWSAWDEPNHPKFISPQRERCSPTAPAVSPATYATLVRALSAQLQVAGGEHRIVLGDLADILRPRAQDTSITEFVANLPEDVVCAGSIWAQHEYTTPGAPSGTPGGVRELQRALDGRGPCGHRARIWVTETGAGDPHAGGTRDIAPTALAAQCRLMHEALLSWYRNPRVSAAFQYSFREDSAFPVGLVNPTLTELYPAYYAWRDWSARLGPKASPPGVPAPCR